MTLEGGEIQTADGPKMIRKQAILTRILTEEPDIERWLIQEYAEKAIGVELRNLPNMKANGGDGIPGEAYKATRKWAIEPITNLMR